MTPKERMAIPPQAMPEQDAQVRAHNMNEVATGYTAEMAKTEASRCLQCPTKPCMQGCPVAINIPGFLAKAAEGDFAGALDCGLGSRLAREVRAEALDAADRDGLVDVLQELAHRAELLALLLLRADAAADGRQKRRLLDDAERAREVARGGLREEARDVDRDGTALHAGLQIGRAHV